MERFLTTPFEEREKAEQSKSLNARLAANQSVISKLEKELADANAERDAEVSGTSSQIISSIWFASTCALFHHDNRERYLKPGETKRRIRTINGQISEKNFTFHVSEINIQCRKT